MANNIEIAVLLLKCQYKENGQMCIQLQIEFNCINLKGHNVLTTLNLSPFNYKQALLALVCLQKIHQEQKT